MKRLAVIAALAAGAGVAGAQAPAAPSCWPLLENIEHTHVGTAPTIADGLQCRWAQWDCIPKDPAGTVSTVTIAGLKSVTPFTTILGRLLNIENKTPDIRGKLFPLMWKSYVTAPIDPICKAEIGLK